MSNITALPGYSIPSIEPVEKVIGLLEEMLQKAKDGKVIGVAIVAAERDPLAFETVFHGEQSSRHTLAAGVLSLHYQLGRAMTDIEGE